MGVGDKDHDEMRWPNLGLKRGPFLAEVVFKVGAIKTRFRRICDANMEGASSEVKTYRLPIVGKNVLRQVLLRHYCSRRCR